MITGTFGPRPAGQLTNEHSFREQQRIQGWDAQTGGLPGTGPARSNIRRRRGNPALCANAANPGAKALTKSGRKFEPKYLARQVGLEILILKLTGTR
jgi:hypothetical protein